MNKRFVFVLIFVAIVPNLVTYGYATMHSPNLYKEHDCSTLSDKSLCIAWNTMIELHFADLFAYMGSSLIASFIILIAVFLFNKKLFPITSGEERP